MSTASLVSFINVRIGDEKNTKMKECTELIVEGFIMSECLISPWRVLFKRRILGNYWLA